MLWVSAGWLGRSSSETPCTHKSDAACSFASSASPELIKNDPRRHREKTRLSEVERTLSTSSFSFSFFFFWCKTRTEHREMFQSGFKKIHIFSRRQSLGKGTFLFFMLGYDFGEMFPRCLKTFLILFLFFFSFSKGKLYFYDLLKFSLERR